MAYIDIDKLTRKLRYIFKTYGVSEVITKKVNKALNDSVADVVEVVRCKDCKKFIKKGEEFILNDVFGICEKSRTGFFDDGEKVYGNDFCSYGKRK